MRRALLVLLVAGCTPEDTQAFQQSFGSTMRGANQGMQQAPQNGAPQRCIDRTNCTEPGAVCMVAANATEGVCVVPK